MYKCKVQKREEKKDKPKFSLIITLVETEGADITDTWVDLVSNVRVFGVVGLWLFITLCFTTSFILCSSYVLHVIIKIIKENVE